LQNPVATLTWIVLVTLRDHISPRGWWTAARLPPWPRRRGDLPSLS